MNSTAIHIKNISKQYRLQHTVSDENGHVSKDIWALRDINITIKKGESVGIIGHNGSGKSTLLKLLAGVTKPTTGEIDIYGKVASILDIGAGFHPDLTGRDNIFLNGQILGFSKKVIRSRINEIIEFSGIEKFIDEPVKNYSNGMYLRLAFSIMAHLDFDIYLLDEVLTVGDAEFVLKSKKKITELLHSKKTVIYVSHDLRSLRENNRFLVFKSGRIINDSIDPKTLFDYSENLLETKLNVFTHPIEIQSHEGFDLSEFAKILRVSLEQESVTPGSSFTTNSSFTFAIEYTKKQDVNTLDVVVNVNDAMGETIFSSSPFIKGEFSSKLVKGNYKVQCEFPAYFFNSQIYIISVYFLLNAKKNFGENQDSTVSENYYQPGNVEIAVSLKDIIAFRGTYYKGGKEFDFSRLNIKGNLLPQLNWKIEQA